MSKRKIPSKIKHSVRFVTLDSLLKVKKGGAYSNLLVAQAIERNQLNPQDAKLYTEMLYGTIARRMLLDYQLAPFIQKAKKVDDWVLALLEMSLYQLNYLDKVPSHAIFNEAVEIAKAKGNPGIAKFVNGVLRNIQRQGVPTVEQIQDPMERLSVKISMPKWLVEKLVAQIGIEETEKLGLSLFEPSHVSARVNPALISRTEAIKQLATEGIEARESTVAPDGIVAQKGFLAGSTLFKQGALTIQDESSMLVARALEVQGNSQVLDACAAPGGKTTHIASFLDQAAGGKVTALDIHDHKIKLIQENAARLHVDKVVQAVKMDAKTIHEHFKPNSFDRILVDAPCSGLGLMRRKPDIKYQKTAEDFKQLPKIQLQILKSAASVLKSNGRLVYSTCTIAPEENQGVVMQFLQENPDFSLVAPEIFAHLPQSVHNQMLTIYPHQYQTDGFFIAVLEKK